MLQKRFFVVAFVVATASLGIPTQVSAAPSIPASLRAVRTIAHVVQPGTAHVFSVSMPWRANMLGVSYDDAKHSAAGVVVMSRSHSSSGWSDWTVVPSADDTATGVEALHVSKRVVTDPIWVGTADRIDVQVSVARGAQAIHDVRVDLINSLGDAHPQNAIVRFLRAAGHFLSSTTGTQATPAAAATSQPPIISRATWGANPKYLNLPCPGIAPDIKMAFVHHTDTGNTYTRTQSPGIVRAIYAYHTNSRGFCDIGYNFLIDKYGQIFEGRNGGITNNVIGAHTGGFNYESFGVALMGQYSQAHPTSAEITALTKLLAWRLDAGHVPAIGTVYMKTGTGNDHIKPGTMVRLNRISAHRNVSYTNCPGNYVYALLPWIRSRVNSIGLPKIYTPLFHDLIERYDGDTTHEWTAFTSNFSTTLHWTLTIADPSGLVRRTLTGTNGGITWHWNGTADDGSAVPSGIYTWTLSGKDAAGHVATPATGKINVVTTHPDGTVLSDATGRYVVDGGAARPIDPVAYASNFGTRAPMTTGPLERGRYATGTAYDLREGTLLAVTSPTPATYYIWSGGELHAFKDGSFTTLGYAPAAAITVPQTYIDSIGKLGKDITDLTQHPDGTLVKTSTGSAYYVIESGARRPISALARASWYRSNEAVVATAGDLLLPAGTAFPVRDGSFIKPTDSGAPWFVSGGTKHRFASTNFAAAMGYVSSMMLTGTAADINAIPSGARIG